jgi:hypothetical protein
MPTVGKFDEEAFADLHALRVFRQQQKDLENSIRALVVKLRGRFVPWEDIASELAITRQAAQQRYARACRQMDAAADEDRSWYLG